MQIGKAIKELRKAAGLSQKELADLADCTQTAISHFEKGTKPPSDSMMVNLGIALNISVAAIYVHAMGKDDIQSKSEDAEFIFNTGKALILQTL